MNYCGIILAKKDSKRLPNKNFLELGTLRVYEHAEVALVESIGEENVSVFSDDWEVPILDAHNTYKERPPAASLPDEPLWSALKWAYKSLPKRYDAIINIMANCPLHTPEGVKKAIERFEALGCDELRSFNPDGTESGLMIVKEKYLLEKHEVSTYQSAIELESIEIHTQEDYEKCQLILSQK